MRTHLRAARAARAAAFALLAAACARIPAATPAPAAAPPVGAAPAKPVVVLSILPQTWFLERVAGDRAKAVVLVGQGQNPHTWEPSPRQLGELASASLWLLSGIDFERGLAPKIAAQFPALPIVDGTAGVAFRPLDPEAAGAHEAADAHDAADAHSAAGGLNADRHSWLGRAPAKLLAANLRDALAAVDPAGAAAYAAGCAAAVADIDAAFDRLAVRLAPLAGRSVFVFHPSFGYFLDEFALKQVAVETGGKEPSAQALAALIDLARREKPAALFVQAQFPTRAARTVAAAVGARVLPLDDLAPDYLANLDRMGEALAAALEPEARP